jgi:L-serine/L-threonine ammonia-lyase
VELEDVSSIATSLGTKNVARRAFELACHGNVRSVILSDTQAALGAVRLMDDERVAVEPACGISAAVVYDNVLKKVCPELGPESNVVLVVCGGNSISAEMLAEYRTTYGRLETPVAIHNYAN